MSHYWEEKIKAKQKEDEERGYKVKHINQIRKQIIQEEREWINLFDDYIKLIIHYESSTPAAKVIEQAAKLVDERMKVIKERNFLINDNELENDDD